MPTVELPRRDMHHEMWLMAETIQQTGEMLNMAATNQNTLFPGAAGRKFADAVNDPGGPIADLQDIANGLVGKKQKRPIQIGNMETLGLVGASGDLKRQFLAELRNESIKHLQPDNDWKIDIGPLKRRDMIAGLDASGEFFEGAATLVRSLVPVGGEAGSRDPVIW